MKINQEWLVVSPAYGRDYKNMAEVKEAWSSNKDFRMESLNGKNWGLYCNKQDFEPGIHVQVRYSKMQKVMVVTA